MLFLPAENIKENFKTGSVVEERYSQMDFMPTLLDIWGVSDTQYLGRSFASEILRSSKTSAGKNAPIITAQLFGNVYIDLIKYPEKYIFDIKEKKVDFYNLKQDPEEVSPVFSGPEKDYFYLIEDFFEKK